MSKEALARAANAEDLSSKENQIRDVDRLTAMAAGNALGGLLLRFNESAQPQWGHRVMRILARRIKHRYRFDFGLATRIAMTALVEYHHARCLKCHGARELVTANLRIVCDACNGLGKQRWSDSSRRNNIGTYGPKIESALTDAHAWMSGAISDYLNHAERRLHDET